MSTLTTNLSLVKPSGAANGDYVDISVLDSNFDLIDAAVTADRVRLTSLESTVSGAPVALTNPVRIRKAADESVVNNTIQNDDDFVLALSANVEYEIDMSLKIKGGAGVGGFQADFTFPATTYAELIATDYSGVALTQPTAVSLVSGTIAIQIAAAQMVTTFFALKLKIYIRPNANGNLQFRWAQLATNATATVVGGGSMLVSRRLA